MSWWDWGQPDPTVDPLAGFDFWGQAGAPPVLDPESVTPTVSDVAALERSRVVDSNGNPQTTFTADTFPATDTDVEQLIAAAVVELVAQLPTNVDPLWYPSIRNACAMRAAIMLETSFFRVQAAAGHGAGNANLTTLLQLYDAVMSALQASVPGMTLVG